MYLTYLCAVMTSLQPEKMASGNTRWSQVFSHIFPRFKYHQSRTHDSHTSKLCYVIVLFYKQVYIILYCAFTLLKNSRNKFLRDSWCFDFRLQAKRNI